MTPRALSALLLALSMPAAGAPADSTDAAAQAVAPDAAASLADPAATAAAAKDKPVAPPLVPGIEPQLAPPGTRHRLNFYSRADLEQFPAEERPEVKPWCSGTYFLPPLPPLPGDEDSARGENAPVYMLADRMNLDDAGESRVTGNVILRQGKRLVQADGATVTADQERVLLDGPVYLQDADITLEAGAAEITLDGAGSRVTDAEYALAPLHVRGKARSLVRDGEYRSDIEGAAYTTCEPGHDTWYLYADRIRLDQESGWGTAHDVSVEVQSVPVFYTPYIRFPIDERRHTGVLYPLLGYSESEGADLGLPVYLNLHPQYDLLLTPRWIEERGALLEAEAGYLLGDPDFSLGEGRLSGGRIDKDRLYGDQERTLVGITHLGNPTENWEILADATAVSDFYYFDDLGTQLSVNRDTQLNRELRTSYSTDYGFVMARVQSFQTIDPFLAERRYPYRREPQVLASGALPSTQLPGLEYLGVVEGVSFDRDISAGITNPVGERTRLEPGLRYTFEQPWYMLAPMAKVRYATYTLENHAPGDTPERAIPTFATEGGLFFERGITVREQSWTQSLEPRIYLLKTPYEDQSLVPVFDTTLNTFSYEQLFRDNRFAGGDRIGDAEQVSLAVETRLFGEEGEEAARFALGQAYYGEDRRVQAKPLAPPDTEPRSPLVALAEWRVSEEWRAKAEAQWLDSNGEFVSGYLRFNWQDELFRTLNIGYRYTDPRIDQTDLSGLLPFADRWSLVGRWIYDLNKDYSLESLAGVEYESCCWRTRLVARRAIIEEAILTGGARLVNDDSFMLEIELKGLGSVGDRLSNELASEIPGYEQRVKALNAPVR